MSRFVKLLLLVPAVLLGLVLSWLSLWAAFLILPDGVVWTSLALLAVVGIWFFFGRQKTSGILPGAESSLLGSHSSKGGLL